jgi:hypothetical protein
MFAPEKSRYTHLQMADSAPNPPTPFERLQRPPKPRVVAAILAGMFLLLFLPGVFTLYLGVTPGGNLRERLLLLALAATFLFLPARMAWVSIGRKLRTGKWTPSPEERLKNRAKWSSTGPSPWFLRAVPALNIVCALAWIGIAIHSRTEIWSWTVAVIWVGICVQSLYRRKSPTA